MTTPATPRTLDRIRALLARASHPTTPEEEARTSAVQAARLIARHGVQVGPGAPQKPVYSVRVEVTSVDAADAEAWETENGHTHWRIYTARVAGRCQECKKGYKKGERIAWRNPLGPVHLSC